MNTKSWMRMAAVAFLTLGAGCGITEPKPIIDEFTWEAVENPNDVVEGADIAGLFRDISFLGQARTPTLCYVVDADLQTSGSTVTITVNLNPSASTTCAQTPGGFRYLGVVRNLERGTYTVRIIQTVKGQPSQEFTEEVTV